MVARLLVRYRLVIAPPLLALLVSPPLPAQLFERSITLPPAEIEQLDPSSAAQLENAKRFLAERQWDEAVEAIRRVQETEPARLVKVDLSRQVAGFEPYITAAQYCQWRMAALAGEAPEALAHYRRLIDALAEKWFREGEMNNDVRLLKRVVEQAFGSRFGDDALLKLGDLALDRGDYSAARCYWQQISGALTVSTAAAGPLHATAGSPLWLALRNFDFTRRGDELIPLLRPTSSTPFGQYPDSDIDPAAVHARRVLVSLFEGSPDRASVELNLLKLLHPAAEGTMAGRQGLYVDELQRLMKESAGWPPRREQPDWTTFGGNQRRGKIAIAQSEPGMRVLWSVALPRLAADREWIGAGRLRVADDAKGLLSYYPIVVGQTVLVRTDATGNSYVTALDLATGKQHWQVDYSRGAAPPRAEANPSDKQPRASDAHGDLARHVGVARYTLSACGDKVFTRMGSPISSPSGRRAGLWLAKDQGFLLGLDLATQGKPLEGFPLLPPAADWTFEGTPLCDEGAIYVAMRRTEAARSQLYLAAFELLTTPTGAIDESDERSRQTGRLKWQRRICSSATLGDGDLDQLSHLLITRDGNRLYFNTSAGAVASVDARDGHLLWLVKYPRAAARTGNPDQPEQHLFRDLTPCLAWKGLVFVAPADSDRLFALEAASGQLAWSLPKGAADDAVHLLGVMDDTLVVSGDSIYWIDAYSGQMMAQFPAGRLGGTEKSAPSPRGFGRGLIAGNRIWWPTREAIYVFEARPLKTDFGWQPKLVRQVPLAPLGITGGNLLFANDVVLIAGSDHLVALGK